MPKRKRKDSSFLNSQKLLDSMASVGLAPLVRLIALVLYYSNGEEDQFSYLSRLTGLDIDTIQSHQIKILEQYGFVIRENDKLQINIPTIQISPIISRKKRINRPKMTDYSSKIIDEYKRLWTDKYKNKCIISGIERTKAMKLVKDLGKEETLRRLNNFMENDDPWLLQNSHPFGVFNKLVNQYTRRPSNGRKKEKTEIIQHGTGEFDEEVREFENRER